MKVLVTGHRGYIGTILVPLFQKAGHEVHGLDNYLFDACTFGDPIEDIPALHMDLRDVQAKDLEGFDAVVHLAGLSNDPLGDLDPSCTYDINHHAAVRLAEISKSAGVSRFLYSSSCSLYGAGGQDWLTEDAQFNPVTPYGESKALVERDVSPMASEHFSPTYLRNSTAYGLSPRLRGDLVVNNLVGYAVTTGRIFIKSDGTPWRPIVHIDDISRAFLAAMEAPREAIHNVALNVGRTDENYQVREIADAVKRAVPEARIEYAEGAGPDKRCYRVDCNKLPEVLPAWKPAWTLDRGIEELVEAYRRYGLTVEEMEEGRLSRIRHIRKLMAQGEVDSALRWKQQPAGA